jgi:orotidine-5'-phosphate decarboxylase
MTTISWIDLVEKNATEFGELVAGIDPHLPELPAFFDHGRDGSWIGDYVTFMLELLKGQVGFVKFQSAYFEACGLKGLTALSAGIGQAKANGMAVILDAKRGDIGSTATAYARAYLTPTSAGGSGDFEVDCLTVAPFMGPDTLEPFVDCARSYGKGLFVLCRTSNPGAGWLQDKVAGNRLISEHVADLIANIGPPQEGAQRLSAIGAVIGATAVHEGRRLRQLMPRSIILAPGLGAQGADAATIGAMRGQFDGDLLLPVSRGLSAVVDRGLDIDAYRNLVLERTATFKLLSTRRSDLARTSA